MTRCCLRLLKDGGMGTPSAPEAFCVTRGDHVFAFSLANYLTISSILSRLNC